MSETSFPAIVVVRDGFTGAEIYTVHSTNTIAELSTEFLGSIGDVDGDGLLDVTYDDLGTGIIVATSGATYGPLFEMVSDSAVDPSRAIHTLGDLDRDGLDDLAVFPSFNLPELTIVSFTPRSNIACIGEPHSDGLGTRLRPLGSRSVAANGFRLEVWNLPPTSFVLLLNTSASAPVMGPGSVALYSGGNLCLSPTSLARHQVLFTVSGGVSEMPVDLMNLPTAGAPGFMASATAGETRFFQCWFRDTAGPTGSNLSDAVAVTFNQ